MAVTKREERGITRREEGDKMLSGLKRERKRRLQLRKESARLDSNTCSRESAAEQVGVAEGDRSSTVQNSKRQQGQIR